ncbi:uncharacterized protein [Musca autumnalis]|uniref:uncharacterized protein n=1 Tax=Musca autumnalis TaxID=221902 RepID=UPI003CF0B8B7
MCSPKEKELYGNMSLKDFIQRLLTKRCVSFVGQMDAYLLLSGETGAGESYSSIGSNKEKEPLTLRNCLSYDEIKLSAFLSISSYTELINNGNRQNRAIIEEDLNKIEREAVVIGLIGARFQRPLVMDYQDIVISRQQNTVQRGYGEPKKFSLWNKLKSHIIPNRSLREKRKLWQKFYEEPSLLYSEVPKDNGRFGEVYKAGSKEIFDNVVMKKRYAISFDTLLMETQKRAAFENKQAYLHVVGIGLGTWRIAAQQTQIFLETFEQRVKYLLAKLNNITVLHFSWFDMPEWGDLKNNALISSKSHPSGGIRILMENRNPGDKLRGTKFENMLLVISYAWDGNALPGNEFWLNHLSGSSDSATASSTLITELHNPFINSEWVCGENLHVSTFELGIVHIREYVKYLNELYDIQ